MDSVQRFCVNRVDAGLKLQVFIKQKLKEGLSVRGVKSLIDRGSCRLNGKLERFGCRLVKQGDRIEFFLREETKESQNIQIVFEDEFLVVVNKPPFVLSEGPNSLEQRVGFHLVHRLDRDTSGLLLFAKDRCTLETMQELFRKREIKKRYVAMVHGAPKEVEGIVENELGPKRVAGQVIMEKKRSGRGKWAKTKWRLERLGKRGSLIECFPFTGRMHQIRVHLSGIGHPVMGDLLYGNRQGGFISRQMLHAQGLSFVHPKTGELCQLKAPLPRDFQEVMDAHFGR